MTTTLDLTALFTETRARSESICLPLELEDYVVQPVDFVSPPKWHLGHTTWFFEEMLLKPYLPDYRVFDSQYGYVFNSYYESLGARVVRTDRGNLSRPSVNDVYRYRHHVDEAMLALMATDLPATAHELLEIGIHHEKQHQELLLTDIKFILGNNPLLPALDTDWKEDGKLVGSASWIRFRESVITIGHNGNSFGYDNEFPEHKQLVPSFQISSELVTNGEYLEFIQAGGYQDPQYWHAEGWDWVKTQNITAPLYWQNVDDTWKRYTLAGLEYLQPDDYVAHVSFYEAFAYAQWRGMRLPTEFEWEATQDQFDWGHRWEWTSSAYMPYPGYKKPKGAVGEYNGKFMVNQQVLRGSSIATPPAHARPTYRNFFHAPLRWQFTGIRLATDHNLTDDQE